MEADDENRQPEVNRGIRRARSRVPGRDDDSSGRAGDRDRDRHRDRDEDRGPAKHDFWEDDPDPDANRGPGYTGGGGPETGPEFREYEFHGLGSHWHERPHHYWNIFDAEERRRRRARSKVRSTALGKVGKGGFGHRGTAPKGYSRSDERIFEDVCEALQGADLDPSDVTVEVVGGEVTLSGSMASRWGKRYAEDLAHSVRGVVDVHNRLRVRA